MVYEHNNKLIEYTVIHENAVSQLNVTILYALCVHVQLLKSLKTFVFLKINCS